MRASYLLLGSSPLPVILLLTACAAAPAAEQPALQLTGRVVDAANLLNLEQEKLLTAKLAALEAHQGAQFVVAKTRTLNGQRIEDYSITLARSWGLGDKERNDGLLLLVAPEERRVRIEVGKGLEVALPDELCARIIREDVTPRFAKGDMFGGIDAGVDALVSELEAGIEPAKANAA